MWVLMMCIGVSVTFCEQHTYATYLTEQACQIDMEKLSGTGAYNLSCMTPPNDVIPPGEINVTR